MFVVASACAAFVAPPRPAPAGRAEFAGSFRLWRNVLARALLDSCGLDMGPAQTRQLMIGRARTWLAHPSADREQVLDLAEFSANDLERALPKLRLLWALADRGELLPEAVGLRGRGRLRAFDRARAKRDC